MGDFEVDTRVEGADGRYTAEISKEWQIWGPMGGYIASTALRAGAAEVNGGLLPASFSCQYFARAEFETVDIDVEVRRASKRTAAVSARLTQLGNPILDAQMWFAADADLITHDHAPMHRFGHPDDHRGMEEYIKEGDEPPFPFWLNFDGKPLMWVEDWDTFEGDLPEWAEWLRFTPRATFDDPVVEACRLLLIADLPSFPAASRAHPRRDRDWVAPNLDLNVQFHRLADLGEWLLCSGVTPVADRGLIGFRSEVWTADGVLAASGGGQLLTRMIPNVPR
jgi:acyl-CoA thioesterase-2